MQQDPQRRSSGECFYFPGVDEHHCSHFNLPPCHIIGHHLGLSFPLPSTTRSSLPPFTPDMHLHVCRTTMLRGGNPTSVVNSLLHVPEILCNRVMTANYKAGFSLFPLKRVICLHFWGSLATSTSGEKKACEMRNVMKEVTQLSCGLE